MTSPAQARHLRRTLAQHLGEVLTPELAALIEVSATTAAKPIAPPLPPRHACGLVLQVERMHAALPELMPLWREHWDTTEGWRSEQAFAPDAEGYLLDDAEGRMLLVTGRRAATQELVGYVMLYLSRSRHSQALIAFEDAFFLTAPARQGLAGLALLRFGVDCMRALNVTTLGVGTKHAYPIDPMLKRLGFTPYGNTWSLALAAPKDSNVL